MNLAEFLVWDPPDGSDRWELIDGAPVHRPAVTVGHGRLTINSAVLLHRHIHRPLRTYLSGSVGPDAWNVRTAALIISAEPITPDALLLREPLIVEIVGPSTARKIATALPLYRTMPSVQEMLVLQSLLQRPRCSFACERPVRRRPHPERPPAHRLWESLGPARWMSDTVLDSPTCLSML